MQILTEIQIQQKIKRIALEIIENNCDLDNLFLLGVNSNGYHFAQLLENEIKLINKSNTTLVRLRISPASPLSTEIVLEPDVDLTDKHIILVDDVANTGRTLFYAFNPILKFLPQKLEVAVLIDRTHKSFPVHSDYVGLSLATTLKENIKVDLHTTNKMSVSLH